MPRIKKKGTAGSAKNYITRTQAVRKLQISLPDFRRLCIFKGIYPREPRNKKKAAKNSTQATTFYYTKDIQYLLHEPLLAKFRDHKALAKKITRALGRNEVGDAKRLERNHAPRISLDHIIKERYPTFVDALRDLDDALSMLFLFANLPQTEAVPAKTIALCKRLCHEFEHYLIRAHALKKSFLSIKGIYYQATIQGQDILWLVPYNFVQQVSIDIDFRVMGTFVDFYTTLLGFVNYRLYTSIGLVYPPVFDAKSDEQGAELAAFTLQGRLTDENLIEDGSADNVPTSEKAQAEANQLLLTSGGVDAEAEEETRAAAVQEPGQSSEIDTFPAPIDPTSDILLQPSISADAAASLFEPFTFYLSRETPRHPLEFILRAFGCRRVGWPSSLGEGAYTADESDRRVTHQIVDRPNLPLPAVPEDDADKSEAPSSGQRIAGRTYIQPQWVWDCINAGKLLRPDLYAPGAVLPPHLSPWVKPTKGEYDPTKSLAEQEAEDEAEAAAEDSDAAIGDVVESAAVTVRDGEDGVADGMDVVLADSDTEGEERAGDADADADEFGGFDDSDEEEPEEAVRRQREIEAEARGTAAPKESNKSAGSEALKRINKRQREQQEEIDRQKMMMSRRKRQLFEKMQHGNNKRDADAERLRAKRRKIEGAKAKA